LYLGDRQRGVANKALQTVAFTLLLDWAQPGADFGKYVCFSEDFVGGLFFTIQKQTDESRYVNACGTP
jgi:hypothetical protein